jgi:uncharacterized membrane protein
MIRPKIKIEMTRFDWVLEAIAFMILIGVLLILILNYGSTPDQIPTHYNMSSAPDAFGSKSSIWILVAINIVLFALLTWISNFPQWYNYPVEITVENAERQYTLAVRMMRVLKIVLTMIFAYILLHSISGRYLGNWFLPALLLSIASVIGIYIFKTKQAPHKG